MHARLARGGAVLTLALAVAVGIPAASLGVDPGGQAQELRQANAALAHRASSAATALYALESRRERAAAKLQSLQRRADVVAAGLHSARARLAAARTTLRVAERLLSLRLSMLYEQENVDPLAVLLGSHSLQEALDGLQNLHLAAEQDRQIVSATLVARHRLEQLTSTLELRQNELRRLRDETTARAAELARASAERRRYLGYLASQQSLNSDRIAALDAAARERAQRLAVPAPAATTAAPAAPAAAPAGGGTLTVLATGYSLDGTTATGLPVGWGVVAVDPAVISLGTRLTIPGYGNGVAADTGPGVRGATIDLWFPTRTQALAWGSRTVTITILR